MRSEKKIDFGGEKRLLKFGTNASRLFCEKHDMGLSEYQEALSGDVKLHHLVDVIWAGLVAGARKEGVDVEFDEFDIGDWIDEADEGTIQEIMSLMQGVPEEEGN